MNSLTDGPVTPSALAGLRAAPVPSVTAWVAPVALLLTALSLHFLPGAAALLQFDRAALAAGEWWRLFTGHLVHFDASHATWDLATVALLTFLHPRLTPRHWLLLLGGAAFIISLAVWALQPQFEIYRGLSGLACALFGSAAVFRYQHARAERDGVLQIAIIALALGFAAKSGFEIVREETVFASAGAYAPVPLAHLIGAACGAGFALSQPATDKATRAPCSE